MSLTQYVKPLCSLFRVGILQNSFCTREVHVGGLIGKGGEVIRRLVGLGKPIGPRCLVAVFLRDVWFRICGALLASTRSFFVLSGFAGLRRKP